MANISAADVKKLRDLTGAGMMDSKKALESSDGDFDKAVEFLRVKGQASAQKRAERSTSNGLVAAHVDGGVGTMIEVACETDFVAKGAAFGELADKLLDQAVAIGASDVATLLASDAQGRPISEVVTEANATIGEKIEVRRIARVEATHVASYLHKTSPDLPAQIGVLVGLDKPSDVGRDVAMHAAAMRPGYLNRDEVPAEVIDSERRIAEEKSREEGKPEAALPRIVEGRVDAFLKDSVLLEQKFAKDPSKTVQKLLDEADTTVSQYVRFQVGA